MAKIHLDSLDRSILTQLVENGRKSFADMAAELNVSAGTIRNRLARLEENNTLRVIGFVDVAQVGLNVYATIHARVSPPSLLDQVVAELNGYPEVIFLATVAGEYALHIDVQCLDNDHLMTLLSERIHTLEGVVDTQTTIVLKVHKYGQSNLEILRILAESQADGESAGG